MRPDKQWSAMQVGRLKFGIFHSDYEQIATKLLTKTMLYDNIIEQSKMTDNMWSGSSAG